MKKFILGFIVGLFASISFYSLFLTNPISRAEIGYFFDKDAVYTKNGNVLHCWIIKENDDEIMVEIDNSYFSLLRKNCVEIRKNYFLKYFRELI